MNYLLHRHCRKNKKHLFNNCGNKSHSFLGKSGDQIGFQPYNKINGTYRNFKAKQN